MGISGKNEANAADDALLHQLSTELQRRLPPFVHNDYELLIPAIRLLPRGLRAMAATHRLDVSLALDDLAWHFVNFHHRAFADETLAGLRELEAMEAADIFEAACKLVEPHWDEIGRFNISDGDAYADWYATSGLDEAMRPLNTRMWNICDQSYYGLMQTWLDYARKHPERMVG